MGTDTREYLSYYYKKLEKFDDEKTVLDTIYKLAKPSVTAEQLQDSGIYKSVHKLTKRKGIIAERALPLYNKWKLLLSIAMKEKASMKNFSPLGETPHLIPSNHSSKPRPDSARSRESDSKCNQMPTRKDHFVPDSDKHSAYRNSRYSNSDRSFKDHMTPSDAAHIGNSALRGSKDLAPDANTSRNPSHRSSDSDSEKGFKLGAGDSVQYSKFRATRSDYFAPSDDINVFGNSCPRTIHDMSEFDSRLSSVGKDVFAPEQSTISYSGGSEQKDNLDTARSGSRSSELNGVSYSQDSNHADIDSLNNPNLNIDGPHTANSFGDCNSDADCSPTKSSKIHEPYHIEMKEGMFRAVKNHNNAVPNSGKMVFEQIHREIMKGNSTYRRERDKPDEKRCNDSNSLPKDLFGDWEKIKVESEQKSGAEKSGNGSSGSSKNDLKRKSSSPYKGGEKRIRLDKDSDHRGSDKRVCPDSTYDQKLKMKKEDKSPSPYKPVNNVHAHQSNCDRNKNSRTKDSPESASLEFCSSARKERRSIYSGKKCVQDVSTLQTFCQRFLKKNLECIRGITKVSYEVLHPILETLNPAQLAKVEEQSPYLLPYTNTLWKQHCNRDYRGLRIMKNEKDIIWKEEYNRAHEQQKKKLKNLTASITAAANKAKPDRQAKLTLVDTQHDPLRRRSKAIEVPVVSLKPANPAVGPRSSSPAVGHRSTSPAVAAKSSPSPSPRPSFVAKPSMPIINMKPKETKHPVPHKPAKKVVAPLMSKVKKAMGAAAYRQK